MKTIAKSTTIHNSHIAFIAIATLLILSVPLVAMQFTNEVKWDLLDFVTIGALLFGTGLLYELVAHRIKSNTYRIALGLGLLAAVALIWVELAVGIF